MKCRTTSWSGWVVGAVLAGGPFASVAGAQIYLNEVRFAAAQVELYNRGANPVDIGDWRIQGGLGDFTIPTGTMINPGEYKVFVGLGGIFEPIGGIVGVLDDVGSGNLQDRVRYGVLGGAPAPPPVAGLVLSLSRSPDASNTPAPPLIPNADELFWTLDFSSTFGAMNDVPNPDLGLDLCINEMLSDPSATLADSVEFCNPPLPFAGEQPIDLTGYVLTTAFGVQALSGTIPPGGFLGHPVDSDLRLGDAFRVDLFAPNGRRIFQKSTFGAPGPRSSCYGDCPDGAGPPDGFDYYTSGGGSTFFPIDCSIGESNEMGGERCRPAGVPEPPSDPEVFEGSWGSVKGRYREP